MKNFIADIYQERLIAISLVLGVMAVLVTGAFSPIDYDEIDDIIKIMIFPTKSGTVLIS